VQRVVDWADHEGPGDAGPSAALGLDHVPEDISFDVPAVPTREAVRPRHPVVTQAAALVPELFVPQEPETVRLERGPASMRPHPAGIVDERADLRRRGGELALVHVANFYASTIASIASATSPARNGIPRTRLKPVASTRNSARISFSSWPRLISGTRIFS
jgi:hypothetical protein